MAHCPTPIEAGERCGILLLEEQNGAESLRRKYDSAIVFDFLGKLKLAAEEAGRGFVGPDRFLRFRLPG